MYDYEGCFSWVWSICQYNHVTIKMCTFQPCLHCQCWMPWASLARPSIIMHWVSIDETKIVSPVVQSTDNNGQQWPEHLWGSHYNSSFSVVVNTSCFWCSLVISSEIYSLWYNNKINHCLSATSVDQSVCAICLYDVQCNTTDMLGRTLTWHNIHFNRDSMLSMHSSRSTCCFWRQQEVWLIESVEVCFR